MATCRASRSFALILNTEGRDVSHLRTALGGKCGISALFENVAGVTKGVALAQSLHIVFKLYGSYIVAPLQSVFSGVAQLVNPTINLTCTDWEEVLNIVLGSLDLF